MEPWILKDGTKVHLGGRVEGDSLCARGIRLEFEDLRDRRISSGFGPIPHEEPLDVSVPHLLDYWLRHQPAFDVVSGPSVEYPELEPRPAPPPGCVY